MTLQAPNTNGEFWGLLRNGGTGQFVVAVYDHRRLLTRFPTGQPIRSDASGTEYTASGQIRLEGTLYQAQHILIERNETSGWIELTPAAQP